MVYDKIIIGAGLYGLYAAEFCARKGERVLVLECDAEPFMRATYINQARVHMGYHYPRSYATAVKSAKYFERFNKEYACCIHSKFKQIYATSATFSWTNAEQFKQFCSHADILCEEINTERYFKKGVCDGAFLTEEYTYDAMLLKQHFMETLAGYDNVSIKYNCHITSIEERETCFFIQLSEGISCETDFLLNATYASTNQILAKFNKKYPYMKLKYELCEIILCKVADCFKDVGITVMDGPFFSIMPFGKTGYHSLTSVTFTPHTTCYESLPNFDCQQGQAIICDRYQLENCNLCKAHPISAWPYMSQMAKKYLLDQYKFEYINSMFSVKPILQASEVDDSRPTVIRILNESPTLVSVLSGKINTVYDLDEVLS